MAAGGAPIFALLARFFCPWRVFWGYLVDLIGLGIFCGLGLICGGAQLLFG
jgi:hypothetical protein